MRAAVGLFPRPKLVREAREVAETAGAHGRERVGVPLDWHVRHPRQGEGAQHLRELRKTAGPRRPSEVKRGPAARQRSPKGRKREVAPGDTKRRTESNAAKRRGAGSSWPQGSRSSKSTSNEFTVRAATSAGGDGSGSHDARAMTSSKVPAKSIVHLSMYRAERPQAWRTARCAHRKSCLYVCLRKSKPGNTVPPV